MRKSGIELIAEERIRQIEVEGYTIESDDTHDKGQLAKAAAAYSLAEDYRKHAPQEIVKKEPPFFWPWTDQSWKPTSEDRVKELIKAGALIAAEIDRLQRTQG